MDLGWAGEWWSSTYANGSSMYYNGSKGSFAAYAQHYADRSGEGATIRCVLTEF